MNLSGDDLFRILGFLGIGICCGLPLILFALITLYAARKHSQNIEQINQAVPLKISTLKVNQLVRLEGVITDVPNKIDGPTESPLALIRFQVIAPSSDDNGVGAGGDKIRAVPFKLDDGSGNIWIDPQGLDKVSMGEGVIPASRDIAEAAVIQTGLHPAVLNSGGRMHMWEYRGGQRVTVIGTVVKWENGLVIKKVKKDPLIITSLPGSKVQVETQKQIRTAWIYTALLGIPGILILLCGLGGMIFNLIPLLGQ